MIRKLRLFLVGIFFVWVGFYASCSSTPHQIRLVPLGWQCPPRHIRVALSPDFSQHSRELATQALGALNRFGITTEIVGINSNPNPNITVNLWRHHDCTDDRIGIYTHGENLVEVDPGCSATDEQFQTIVVHEIGHWLGLRHICNSDNVTSDRCSDIGRGVAVMNPYLSSDQSHEPTQLDIDEYTQTCWLRFIQ